MPVIQAVEARSPAARAGIRPGESLIEINGKSVADVLDYQYHSYDARLILTVKDAAGAARTVTIKKGDGQDLGLTFESYLMDDPKTCANRCIFCFVDQLPPGMRDTLYFKDDDARLSFLTGSYITLTNLTEREAERIIGLKISPVNISVHATDPDVRALLLGHRNAGRGFSLMRRFAAAGIEMNCQVVACPGINDGAVLQKTMEDLAALYPAMHSLSVVPVGLTRHRQGLHQLQPYTKDKAAAVIDLVESFAEACLARYGSRVFWCSDEFYLLAGRDLPDDEIYEEYTQLENGVGMLRLLRTEFVQALQEVTPRDVPPCAIATGVAAAPFLRELVDMARVACNTRIQCEVYAIVNDFFGHTVDVAGLVTGGDLIAQLRGKALGGRLLIPAAMLRHGEGVFLDNVTVAEVEAALGVPLVPVGQDGYDLCAALFGG